MISGKMTFQIVSPGGDVLVGSMDVQTVHADVEADPMFISFPGGALPMRISPFYKLSFSGRDFKGTFTHASPRIDWVTGEEV